MDSELQRKVGARISKNGKGIEGKEERNHPVQAYPSRELAMASSSSAEKKRSEGMRGVERSLLIARREHLPSLSFLLAQGCSIF